MVIKKSSNLVTLITTAAVFLLLVRVTKKMIISFYNSRIMIHFSFY